MNVSFLGQNVFPQGRLSSIIGVVAYNTKLMKSQFDPLFSLSSIVQYIIPKRILIAAGESVRKWVTVGLKLFLVFI